MAVSDKGRVSFTPTAEKFGRWLDRQTDRDLAAIAAEMLKSWSTPKARFYYHPGEDKAVFRPIIGETAIEVSVPRKKLRDQSDAVPVLKDGIRDAIISYLTLTDPGQSTDGHRRDAFNRGCLLQEDISWLPVAQLVNVSNVYTPRALLDQYLDEVQFALTAFFLEENVEAMIGSDRNYKQFKHLLGHAPEDTADLRLEVFRHLVDRYGVDTHRIVEHASEWEIWKQLDKGRPKVWGKHKALNQIFRLVLVMYDLDRLQEIEPLVDFLIERVNRYAWAVALEDKVCLAAFKAKLGGDVMLMVGENYEQGERDNYKFGRKCSRQVARTLGKELTDIGYAITKATGHADFRCLEMLRNGLFPNARVHMETNTYLFLRGMSMSLKESGLDLSALNMQTLTKYVEPAAELFESGTYLDLGQTVTPKLYDYGWRNNSVIVLK